MKFILQGLLFLASSTVFGQQNAITVNNFTVMVLPFTTDKNQGEIYDILSEKPFARAAIAEVREKLGIEGFQTVDFFELYKKAKNESIIARGLDVIETKKAILDYSKVDFYVEIDPILDKSSGGDKVRIVMNCVHTSTAVSMVIVQCDCNRRFYDVEPVKLTEKATECCMLEFMSGYREGLNQLAREGQQVQVQFRIEDSTIGLDLNELEVIGIDGTSMPFSYAVEEWLELNANYYHLKNSTNKILFLDQVRIPFIDEAGNFVNTSSFRRKLFLQSRKFIRSNVDKRKLTLKENSIGSELYFILEEEE